MALSASHRALESMTRNCRPSPRRAPRWLSHALLGATLLVHAPKAHADRPDEEHGQAPGDDTAGAENDSARLLDAQGTALLSQRRVAEACPQLAESYRLQPGTGVLLRLALCQELLGKRATAWTLYLDAAERARTSDDGKLVALAERRAAALEPQLARLTIHLDATAKEARSVEVLRNGSPLELTSLGEALPVDPGPQVIEAVAPGRRRFQDTVLVRESPGTYSITITLPTTRPSLLPPPPQVRHAESASSGLSTQHWLAVGAGGIGLVGVTIGSIFGLSVSSKMSRARDSCTSGTRGCSDEALAVQDEARDAARVSTLAFGAGLAGLAGGVALWLTAPKASERPLNALRAVPLIARDTAGLQAVGSW